ncbi:unnamed protein product [Rotaria sp. Silwood1]|nr:unnamed protein product [Rotaria sp. Silwood1]CAF3807240.1 unnamed protein product [Rotaria sp. Silwood1]CAF4515327.1 unnamed protein product [Rotaria sp. Silwood1]
MYVYVFGNPFTKDWRKFLCEDFPEIIFVTLWSIGAILFGNRIDACISKNDLENFLSDSIPRLMPVEISVYDDNDDDFEFDQNFYQSKYKNIRFRRLRISKKKFDNGNANEAIIFNNNRTNLNLQVSSIEENHSFQPLIPYNHSFRILQRSVLFPKNGFFVKNIEDIDQCFICPSCRLIFRDPYRLHCGHRQCQSCINLQHRTIHCLSCSKTSTTDEVSLDKAFQAELECLSIFCSFCDWTGPLKIYQDHLDHTHVDRFFICSLCTEQVERSKIVEHYMTGTHQLMLINILRYLQSIKIKNDQQKMMRYSQFHERISNLSGHTSLLYIRMEQIRNQSYSHQQALESKNHELFLLKSLSQNVKNHLDRMRIVQDSCMKDVLSLEYHFEHRQIVSFNGILIWKISNVQERIDDAKFERQRSIYSPEFHSSSSGYKMRARLFLNGTDSAQDTHMSIFFILMRGEYDAILKWPFPFKMIFSLINQLTTEKDRHHLSQFFWPDKQSICFQRPRLEMNEAYGIKKFISLNKFQQNRNQYVQDDTMFIKIEVDFLSIPPGNHDSTTHI